MTIDQIITDASAVLGAVGVICTVLAHLPFSPKWAERFARFAAYASNAKFSINQRTEPPPPRVEPPKAAYIPTNSMTLLVSGLCLFGCAGTESHACNPADVAAITAEYIADMSAQCQGFTFDSCPARPALEAKLKAEHEAKCPTH